MCQRGIVYKWRPTLVTNEPKRRHPCTKSEYGSPCWCFCDCCSRMLVTCGQTRQSDDMSAGGLEQGSSLNHHEPVHGFPWFNGGDGSRNRSSQLDLEPRNRCPAFTSTTLHEPLCLQSKTYTPQAAGGGNSTNPIPKWLKHLDVPAGFPSSLLCLWLLFRYCPTISVRLRVWVTRRV